jgi:uncharacterized membrane protein YdcZ (DUF606 family)
MTVLVIILALIAGFLAVFRRRVNMRRFAWRTWISLAIGAVVGIVINSLLEPFLRTAPAFHMLPPWLWELGMAIVGVFMVGVPIRQALDEAIPPNKQEPPNDVRRPR